MMPMHISGVSPLSPPVADSVEGLADAGQEPPTIVSISDVHGYLEPARSALLTLTDHPEFDPLVISDEDGTPHWADKTG